MKILSAWRIKNGKKAEITQEIYEKDYPILLKRHREACRDVIFWDVFGGVLSIEDRNYQVCEDIKHAKKS